MTSSDEINEYLQFLMMGLVSGLKPKAIYPAMIMPIRQGGSIETTDPFWVPGRSLIHTVTRGFNQPPILAYLSSKSPVCTGKKWWVSEPICSPY
jgi:hypothetical protein